MISCKTTWNDLSSSKRPHAWWTNSTQLMLSTLILPRPLISLTTYLKCENEVVRFWWCRRAVDWSIHFWTVPGTTVCGEHSSYFAGLRDWFFLVFLFRERPPSCPWSTDTALCGWFQNDYSAGPEHKTYPITVRCWSKKRYLPINPVQCSYLIIGRDVLLSLSIFHDGSRTPISVFRRQFMLSLSSAHCHCE